MTIKDPAIAPFWIVSNFHGLTLWEQQGAKEVKHGTVQLNQMAELLQDVTRRKIAAIEGEGTLLDYIKLEGTIFQGIMEATGQKVNKQQVNEPVMQEQIN